MIDAVVAAQTTPGQDAMMEFLDLDATDDVTLPERYLLAAAFSTHPSYKLLQDLLVSGTRRHIHADRQTHTHTTHTPHASNKLADFPG